jgi:hypothetical protein
MSVPNRLDRREFLAVAAAAGFAAALPVALVPAAPAVGNATPTAKLADWHVDDMWGVYPRPHEAVGFGRPHGDGEPLAGVDPVDIGFVA